MTAEPARPLVSVITPVYRVPPWVLAQTVASIQEQDFQDWELCLVDDGSDQPELEAFMSKVAAADDRIRLNRRSVRGGISAATNDGLAMARGDYVALVDHDDLLAPTALGRVANALEDQPDAELVYTDEATFTSDGLVVPYLKPDWSPDYLETCMYIGHLTVYRRSMIQDVGGLRAHVDGSQDWDLALRVTELTDRVVHVPEVLYFWRATHGSAALAVANKRWAVDAGRRALEERLTRQGTPGTCEPGPLPGTFRLRREVRGRPLVTVIIPTAGHRRTVRGRRADLIADCSTSVLSRTTYQPFEVVCVVDSRLPSRVERFLAELDERVRIVRTARPFNFSHRINLGAANATGEYLVLLNDDTEVITPDWMTYMLEVGQDPGVGAVGAKLRFGDGSVQHAGVAIARGGASHLGFGLSGDEPGYAGMLVLTNNRCAITGACLLTPTDLFRSVGGLSLDFPTAFNDVDYCYKLSARGYRIVMVPAAELYHFESSTRVPWDEGTEGARLAERWPDGLARDPFYNPAFTGNAAECGLPEVQLPRVGSPGGS
jgi:glycosyltransferase involved in cell wall biosynthesis